MSMWQWQAAVNGYIAANTGKAGKLSETEKDDLWSFVNDNDKAPSAFSTMTYVVSEDGRLVPAGMVSFRA